MYSIKPYGEIFFRNHRKTKTDIINNQNTKDKEERKCKNEHNEHIRLASGMGHIGHQR